MTDHDLRFRGEVRRNEALTPVMRRIVLGGPGLAGFASSGYADEWLRLQIPAGPEPVDRWYTVRRWDADAGELTVDVVIHAHGAATRWAETAAPGAVIALSAPAGRYAPPPDCAWQLIIADQTGLPAAGRILEELAPGPRAYAVVEAPDPAATVALTSPGEVEVHWVFNPAPDRIASPLAATARSFPVPDGPGYVWMAGEASCSRDIRRYFRHELGWRSKSYDIVGYWRPDSERYLERYRAIEDEVAAIWDRGEARGEDTEAIADEIYAVMESHGL